MSECFRFCAVPDHVALTQVNGLRVTPRPHELQNNGRGCKIEENEAKFHIQLNMGVFTSVRRLRFSLTSNIELYSPCYAMEISSTMELSGDRPADAAQRQYLRMAASFYELSA